MASIIRVRSEAHLADKLSITWPEARRLIKILCRHQFLFEFAKQEPLPDPREEPEWWSTGYWNRGNRMRAYRMRFAMQKGQHSKREWDEMCAAYDETCLACGKREIGKDHIVPIHLGGSDAITNIQPLCFSCNTSKTNDTTDHRIGHPATRPEWLPQQRQRTG